MHSEREIRKQGMAFVIPAIAGIALILVLFALRPVRQHGQHPSADPILDAESSSDGRHMITAHDAASSAAVAMSQRHASEYDPYNELDVILMRVEEAASTGLYFIQYKYRLRDCSFVSNVGWCTTAWKNELWSVYYRKLTDLGFAVSTNYLPGSEINELHISWQQ